MNLGMFDRKEFVAFVLGNLSRRFPEAMILQLDSDFSWELVFSEDKKLRVYLGNVWEDYNKSKDIRTVLAFLDAQESMYHRLSQKGQSREFVLERVYPYIRTVNFMQRSQMMTGGHGVFIYKVISEELVMLFAEDNADYLFFITKNCGISLTDDELIIKAILNLKGLGWTKPNDSFVSRLGSRIFVWEDYERPYQAQFLLYDWAREYLGRAYFIAYPSNYVTVVYIPVNLDVVEDLIADDLLYFKSYVLYLYNKSERKLSHMIHQVFDGEVSIIG